jgi:hypothetical protein
VALNTNVTVPAHGSLFWDDGEMIGIYNLKLKRHFLNSLFL